MQIRWSFHGEKMGCSSFVFKWKLKTSSQTGCRGTVFANPFENPIRCSVRRVFIPVTLRGLALPEQKFPSVVGPKLLVVTLVSSQSNHARSKVEDLWLCTSVRFLAASLCKVSQEKKRFASNEFT